MGPSGGSERKRKVEELFGDITDIELEDRDTLDTLCKCKLEYVVCKLEFVVCKLEYLGCKLEYVGCKPYHQSVKLFSKHK
jgi:hypothetical protein